MGPVTFEFPHLDPDDPRPKSIQIAGILRAAILTGAIATGDRLPSQRVISEAYGVARLTVERALAHLHGEHLVATRKGSGTYATGKPGLRYPREDEEVDERGESAPLVFDLLGANLLNWDHLTEEQRLAWWDLDRRIRHLRTLPDLHRG